MAIRFTKGASLTTTRTLNQKGKVPPPQSNSMKGMPGFINTAQKRDSSDTLNGPGVGPKREGPVGHKGGAHRANKQNGRGSTDPSYRASSTARPGTYDRGKMESLKGKARTSWEK